MTWRHGRERERWLTGTLDGLGDAVISIDARGCVTLMNSIAEQWTGWRQAEARGRAIDDVVRLLAFPSREPASPLLPSTTDPDLRPPSAREWLLIGRDSSERLIAESQTPIAGESGTNYGSVLVLHDVTERALGEAALRASQEMFRLITDHVSDMIAVLDLEGRRLYNSRSYERILGSSEALYLTESFREIHPDDRERIRQVFAETLRNGVGQRTEYRMLAHDGRTVFIESLGSVVHDHRGHPEKVLVVSRDVTSRREKDARLREEHDFIETLINSMPGIFYLYDRTRVIRRWNRNFETVTGYNAEEIAALDPLVYFSEEDKALVHERMLKCFAEGKADIEVAIRHKDGRLTPYYVSGLRILVAGRPCMLGVGIDVTARKAAEREVAVTLERLQRQNTTLSALAHHPGLLSDQLTRTFEILTEAASSALAVQRASIWFYNGDRTRLRCAQLFDARRPDTEENTEISSADYPAYFRALEEGRTMNAHYARMDPRTSEFTPGYLVPLGIRSMLDAPIRSGGTMIGVICHEHTGAPREWTLDEQNFASSIADLTALCLEVWQRRQAEASLRDARDNLEVKVAERTRDLEQANERLKDLDRLKSQFLATMSHELRTPLNSIIGFTGILRQGLAGPLNPEQQKQLGMVHFSAKHLLGLINDLLDLSRIESGKMDLNVETFRLREVVEEVLATLLPQATGKKILLSAPVDHPDLELHSDRKRCFQILLNLTSNAVKFTEHGSVTIVVQAEPALVKISVTDTGIGIKPESMKLLFEAFRQVDGSARRVYEGTGLGLYLCRQLAAMLGGKVFAESQFGKGSSFVLTLPRTSPTKGSP